MNLTTNYKDYMEGRISLKKLCRELDNLGYTIQERRHIIEGLNKQKVFEKRIEKFVELKKLDDKWVQLLHSENGVTISFWGNLKVYPKSINVTDINSYIRLEYENIFHIDLLNRIIHF